MRKFAFSALFAGFAFAQTPAPPAFEVASVKINRQDPFGERTLNANANTLTMRNLNLRVIAAWAYHLQWPQIAGPAWIDSDRFDIIAKAAKPLSEDDTRTMLQALLAERFHFAAHRETRETEVLALTVPKGGHKMAPSTKTQGAGGPRQDPVRGTVIEGVTLSDLCENMSHDTNSIPVVDQTGLKGRFDFSFNMQKYRDAMRSRVISEGRPIAEAEMRLLFMQDLMAGELGLKVEQRRAPVEFLVIDRVDQKPTEN
jgi:uncharacterized protein (TIGR03435 family)